VKIKSRKNETKHPSRQIGGGNKLSSGGGAKRAKSAAPIGGRSVSESFQEILENIPLAAVALNLHGEISLCNDFLIRHLGGKRRGIMGKNWFDHFVPAFTRDKLRPLYFQNILLETFPARLDYEIQGPQGMPQLISWTHAFLRDERGRITGLFAIGTEVKAGAIPRDEKEKAEAPLKNDGADRDEATLSFGEGERLSNPFGMDSPGAPTGSNRKLPEDVKDSKKRDLPGAGKYLTFSLGGEEFGIEVEKVKEIVGVTPIRPFPKAPDYIKGVINLRGQMIPIVDLRLKFGMEEVAYTPKTCIVVLEMEGPTGRRKAGVIVDTVLEVLNIKSHEIENPPEFGAGIETEYIGGLCKMHGKVRILLNLEEVFLSEVLGIPAGAAAPAKFPEWTVARN
jgi:purine-binding chemotaxis protein CheW